MAFSIPLPLENVGQTRTDICINLGPEFEPDRPRLVFECVDEFAAVVYWELGIPNPNPNPSNEDGDGGLTWTPVPIDVAPPFCVYQEGWVTHPLEPELIKFEECQWEHSDEKVLAVRFNRGECYSIQIQSGYPASFEHAGNDGVPVQFQKLVIAQELETTLQTLLPLAALGQLPI